MRNRILLFAILLAVQAQAQCLMVKMEVERLPDMNIARGGHQVFYAGGELVVAGGHTTNYEPTLTAERFVGGQWQLMEMAYPHDNVFVTSEVGIAVTGLFDPNKGKEETKYFYGIDYKPLIQEAVFTEELKIDTLWYWYKGYDVAPCVRLKNSDVNIRGNQEKLATAHFRPKYKKYEGKIPEEIHFGPEGGTKTYELTNNVYSYGFRAIHESGPTWGGGAYNYEERFSVNEENISKKAGKAVWRVTITAYPNKYDGEVYIDFADKYMMKMETISILESE